MPAAVPRRRCASLVACAALALAATLTSSAATARAAGHEVCAGYGGCSAATLTTHDYAAHAARSYWEMDAGDECTNYAAFVEQTVYGVAAPDYVLGDGGSWASAAAAHGVAVDHTPTVGAVAEWEDDTPGIGGPGHVGIVEAVGPDGRWIEISQQHIDSDADGYDWMRIVDRPSDTSWEPWPSSFIHFATPVLLPDGIELSVDRQAYRIAGAPSSAAGSAGGRGHRRRSSSSG